MDVFRDSFPARQLRVRPLACFSACFLLGLIVALRWSVPGWVCAGVAALGGTPLAARHFGRRTRAAALILLALGLGMGRMTLARSSFPAVGTRYSVPMEGRVISDPFTNPDTGRVICKFRLDKADGAPGGMTLRLYLRGDEAALDEIAYGQRLQLTGHIWAQDPVTNPYQFDFGAFLHRDGMAAIATAKIEDVTIEGTDRDLWSVVVDCRHAISRRIDALFPRGAGMVRALVLGDRSMLSEEMREALNATGTAHLISISGLHVTVLAMALTFLLSRFMSRPRAGALALLPLLFYGALIGFTAPFVRALVMFAVFTFAPLAGSYSDSVTRLSAAMLIWLMIHPLDVGDGGFTLSYLASAGIILLLPPIQSLTGVDRLERRGYRGGRVRRMVHACVVYLPSLLCASLAAQLATLPAVVACFGVQSVVSIPFNLVCVPLCMLGYIGALIALVLSAVSLPLGMLLARAPEALFDALAAVTRFSTSLPVTVARVGRYPVLLVIVHGAVMLASSNLSRLRMRVRRWLPLGLVLVAAMSSMYALARAWPFTVTFLDAGQADCAVVTTRGRTYLFDTGDTYTPAGDYLNATCLKLDGVFLSHPHQDHAGGLIDILASFRPGAVFVPAGWFDVEVSSPAVVEGIELAESMGIPIVELAAGDHMALSDAAEMTVYNPDRFTLPDEVNDMSLLQLVESEGTSVMFTGDLTLYGEPEDIPECDVLKVAHHGADNATSYRFLEAAVPDIAVISVGENSFGHPGEDALERLEASGAEILRTDRLGAITLTHRGGEWRMKSYLEASNEVE